jgi:hypothetical protein
MPLTGNCLPPQKITTASLKGLWVPHWESGQVNNAGCSQLTDWSGNGFHLTQATGSLQPLFKQDTTYKGKWYVKFDGVDDVMTNASDPLTTNAGQIFIICRFPNTSSGIFGATKISFGVSLGTFARIDSAASGNGAAYPLAAANVNIVGAKGCTNQYCAMVTRKPSSGNNFLNVNGFVCTSTTGIVATLESSGITLGHTAVNANFWSGEIACLALYEGTNLSTADIQGLINWSHREFEVYRDLMNNKL